MDFDIGVFRGLDVLLRAYFYLIITLSEIFPGLEISVTWRFLS